MECSLGNLARKTDGAAAPTVALLIVVLVAMAGIGFDYSRLASLDTELQNAADQAALAAASQLDQEAGTIDRATAAAEDLVNNLTLFGNDGSSDGSWRSRSRTRAGSRTVGVAGSRTKTSMTSPRLVRRNARRKVDA